MMFKADKFRGQSESSAAECKLHWSDWLLISFAFLALGSMILHTILHSGR